VVLAHATNTHNATTQRSTRKPIHLRTVSHNFDRLP
jgi:hypothetical protein